MKRPAKAKARSFVRALETGEARSFVRALETGRL
jgi:hypothetical protein